MLIDLKFQETNKTGTINRLPGTVSTGHLQRTTTNVPFSHRSYLIFMLTHVDLSCNLLLWVCGFPYWLSARPSMSLC